MCIHHTDKMILILESKIKIVAQWCFYLRQQRYRQFTFILPALHWFFHAQEYTLYEVHQKSPEKCDQKKSDELATESNRSYTCTMHNHMHSQSREYVRVFMCVCWYCFWITILELDEQAPKERNKEGEEKQRLMHIGVCVRRTSVFCTATKWRRIIYYH